MAVPPRGSHRRAASADSRCAEPMSQSQRAKVPTSCSGARPCPGLRASRQVAGLNVTRQTNKREYIDATTAVVSVPVLAEGSGCHPPTERVSDRWPYRAVERSSRRTSPRWWRDQWRVRTGRFVLARRTCIGLRHGDRFVSPVRTESAPARVRPDGRRADGSELGVTRRLRTGFGYMHTATEKTPLFPANSKSDYVSSSVSMALTRGHTVFANGVWNRNLGGLGNAGQLSGRRLDTGLSSQFGRKIANNFQLSVGALADPLQLASRSQFSVRENLSVVTGRGVAERQLLARSPESVVGRAAARATEPARAKPAVSLH